MDNEEPYVAENPYIVSKGGEGQGGGGGKLYPLVVPGSQTDGDQVEKGLRGGRQENPPSSEEVRSFD